MQKKEKNPRVTICLCNLNYRPYLEERLNTIIDQTFNEWELIVFDAYSDDGSWEMFEEYQKKEPRMSIFQAPRQGHMYVELNRCIKMARGEYIYIATSDDTMMPDCLEKMVDALDRHKDCDICHSCLRIIDEKGNHIEDWWENFSSQKFYGDLINKWHIRKAPIDGILHFTLGSIYTSLTQLLIRKNAFHKVGLFRIDFPHRADFEWNMRASLVCNTLHSPEYLATWRIHKQETIGTSNSENRTNLMEMAVAASEILKKYNPELYEKLKNDMKRLLAFYDEERILFSIFRTENKKQQKIKKSFVDFMVQPSLLMTTLWRKITRLEQRRLKYIKNYILSLSVKDNVIVI